MSIARYLCYQITTIVGRLHFPLSVWNCLLVLHLTLPSFPFSFKFRIKIARRDGLLSCKRNQPHVFKGFSLSSLMVVFAVFLCCHIIWFNEAHTHPIDRRLDWPDFLVGPFHHLPRQSRQCSVICVFCACQIKIWNLFSFLILSLNLADLVHHLWQRCVRACMTNIAYKTCSINCLDKQICQSLTIGIQFDLRRGCASVKGSLFTCCLIVCNSNKTQRNARV